MLLVREFYDMLGLLIDLAGPYFNDVLQPRLRRGRGSIIVCRGKREYRIVERVAKVRVSDG